MPPQRVLLIEDDDLSRDLLEHLLTREGYSVQSAASAEHAIELVTQAAEPPTVVLSDLQLPGISGSDLSARLHEACPATLLLAMSGSTPEQNSLQHFHGFLLKPFSMSALGEAIASRRHAQTISLPNSTAVLEQATLQKLQGSMPSAKLAQLYQLCVDDISRRVESMREAAAVSDDATYRRQAHAIKGGCGMVGAMELQTLATSAENDGLPANHVATFDEFLAALQRLESMLVANGTLEKRTAPSR